jgi:hypothetical protein
MSTATIRAAGGRAEGTGAVAGVLGPEAGDGNVPRAKGCRHYLYQLGKLKCDDGKDRAACTDCGAVFLEATEGLLRILPRVHLK